MRVSLCLLTWNELEGCKHDVPLLPRFAFDEVFAIDGGSTDGTVEYLESQGIPVHRQTLPGYNGAYISAFRQCATDALTLFHPKGSIIPTELRKVRPLLEQGYDLVVASRMIPGAVNEEDDRLIKPRKWFVLALAMISSLMWRREGNPVWDVLHGFRAMRKEAFLAISPLELGLSIDLEMVVRSYRRRLRRIEFAVMERPRLHGDTHFKAFATGKKLIGYLLLELTRRA